jgi:hypothetical protein
MFGPVLRRLFGTPARTHSRPVRLGLDVFEDRVVPASVTFLNGTLLIEADQATADTVRITPTGTAADGSTGVKVRSTLTGASAVTFGGAGNPVTTIALDLKDGDDRVNVASLKSVVVLVGEGNGNNVVKIGDARAGGVITGSGRNDLTIGNGTDNLFGSTSMPGTAGSVAFVGWGYTIAGGGTQIFLNGAPGNANDNVIRMKSDAGSRSFVEVIGGGDNWIRGGAGDDGVSIVGGGNNSVRLREGNDYLAITGDGDNCVGMGVGANTVVINGGGDNRVRSRGTGSVTVTGGGVNRVHVGADPNNEVRLNGAAAGSKVVASASAVVVVNGTPVVGPGTFDGVRVRVI